MLAVRPLIRLICEAVFRAEAAEAWWLAFLLVLMGIARALGVFFFAARQDFLRIAIVTDEGNWLK